MSPPAVQRPRQRVRRRTAERPGALIRQGIQGALLLSLFTGVLRAAPPEQPPVIEVREGGYREPQPHRAVLQMFGDGRIVTRQETRRITPAEVARLLERLKELGAFALTQDQLDSELASGAEARPGARGGSGVVTLVLAPGPDRPRRTIWLNQPRAYERSQLHSARAFFQAWQTILRSVEAGRPASTTPESSGGGGR